MTSTIDQLLHRARLIDQPECPVPVTERHARPRPRLPRGDRRRTTGDSERDAARDLRTLCETVVTQTDVDLLGDFLTHSLIPEPDSAVVLGCFLQLGGFEDGARFWWQFAAGADDNTASFCLYLQHLSLGELAPAAWWQDQTPGAAPLDEPAEPTVRDALPQFTAGEANLPTTLRILRKLKCPERPGARTAPWPPLVRAVVDYVVAAVGYVDDDLELPLPDPDFTDRIRRLSCIGSVPADASPLDPAHPERSVAARPLPSRSPGRSGMGNREQPQGRWRLALVRL
ncbi:hypothetical protein ACQB60_09385 [Actinomycetota bacterium Odt1-20B]